MSVWFVSMAVLALIAYTFSQPTDDPIRSAALVLCALVPLLPIVGYLVIVVSGLQSPLTAARCRLAAGCFEVIRWLCAGGFLVAAVLFGTALASESSGVDPIELLLSLTGAAGVLASHVEARQLRNVAHLTTEAD